MQFEMEATHLLRTITSRNLASERVEDIRLTLVSLFKRGVQEHRVEGMDTTCKGCKTPMVIVGAVCGECVRKRTENKVRVVEDPIPMLGD
jgi:hypothetical protein